ncbi:DUF1090 domain-containing protein [Pseudomonas sp. URMO17WK12:I2]|uniref:DUF1090 domain-containing protein n=1 Tax=Pseudomonas sp. URMO17WK12:I2 TaxID=1261623 RepID=UPI000DAE68AF|nr:DUF1090 domain-containing protein [Pseudomonas sp. URMO17WK12:I2]PZW47373.1 uncharacterized protein DUF1090 [Pseudomonas sp. URMO17WK12:I2]
MKALIACLLFVVALPVLADSSANPLCETKAAKIEQQLQAAWAEGLADKAKGLSAALDSVRENCSDKELMHELQARIDKARDEIREREADLRDAELSGDPGKIAKRQAKLDEAMQELKAAEAEFPR